MLAIINAELVMRDHLIPEADLIIPERKMNVSTVILAGTKQ